MNEQKGFFTKLGELIDARHGGQRHALIQDTQSQPGRLRRFLRWLMPNGGTLLLVAALIVTAQVWAKPLTGPASAPGPSATTVNYQGRLADSGGAPLDGSYGMTFALYDAATDGSLVWGPESHAAVPVSGGLFSVGLGSQTSGGIPTTTWGGDRYLEIAVGGETLSPRELIRSVPIAGMALTVPDGAIESRNVTPTVFEAFTSDAVSVGSESIEVLSLDVDFLVDGTYLIFAQVTSMSTNADIRIISQLKNENGDTIDGGVIHTHHSSGGHTGTHTGSVVTMHNFGAGSHEIKLLASATRYDSGTIRSAHIIAMPFARAP